MTNLGKDICNHLKDIRRQIARENDIALDIPECTYKGECTGTCPRCEAELKYLESELTHRSSLGKAALVAGVALTLATSPAVMAQERTDQTKANEQQVRRGKCQLRGQVVDVSGEPLIGANVVLKQQGQTVAASRTNLEGEFEIKNIRKGTYVLSVSYIGFRTADTTVEIRRTSFVRQTLINEPLQGIIPVIVGMPAPPNEFGDTTACDNAAREMMPTIETVTPSGSDGDSMKSSENLKALPPSSIEDLMDAPDGPKNNMDAGEPGLKSDTRTLRNETDDFGEPIYADVQLQPVGTPASAPAEPQQNDNPKSDNLINPLDKKAR